MESESPHNESPYKTHEEINSEEESDNYELHIMPSLHSHSSEYSEPPILSYSYSGISNASSNPELSMHSSRMYEEPASHFNFVKAEKMFSSIQKMVGEVKETFLLDEDIILWLLSLHKWNKDRLNEEFYNKSELYAEKNMELKNYKEKPGSFISNGLCEVCSEEKLLMKNITCCHSYCRDCWKSYIHEKLNENTIFFSCMNKCPNSPILLHNFVETNFNELFEFYRKMICINFAALNKSITYCPSKKQQCNYFCEKNELALASADNNIECECGELYCFICNEEPHFPAHCDTVKAWKKLLNSEEGNSKWIQNNTKTCPSCKSSVEKYIGCSKIKCICGAEFCYECNAKWDETHKSNKGECAELVRRSSFEGRVKTNDFLRILEFSLMVSRTEKKHSSTINTILEYLKEEWMLSKFHGIRKEVSDACFSLKWGCISNFLYKKEEVESFLQEEFIQSITKLIESIEKIQRITNFTFPKELQAIGDEVINRRDALKKNKEVWIEAWRSL